MLGSICKTSYLRNRATVNMAVYASFGPLCIWQGMPSALCVPNLIWVTVPASTSHVIHVCTCATLGISLITGASIGAAGGSSRTQQ
jgi:hypothetical protein